MPQSLSAVYPPSFLDQRATALFERLDTREALHAYLGGVSKTLECPPIIVGGMEDHAHLLA
jgi:REP-associated tyrosine transposase